MATKFHNRKATAAVTLAALLAAGTAQAAAPKPAAPKAPVAWTAALTGGLQPSDANAQTLARWWEVLKDPLLTSLEDRALSGSLDVKAAEARVRQAWAQRGATAAGEQPSLDLGGGTSRSATANNSSARYNTGLDASWEIDLFGRRRNVTNAAEAAAQASEESLRDVQVTLASEVALSYVDLRVAQQRLARAEANLKLQEESYDIARWRNEAGLTTALDVDQARLSVEQTRAQLPTLRTTVEQAKNRLAVLTGQAPGALGAELGAAATVPVAPVQVAVGVPADLLRRRPDVRRAEREVAVQMAQVKAAEAEKYPHLSLNGSIGLEALSFTNLLSAAARVLVGAFNIGQTLFDGGRIRQNIAVQNAAQEQAVIAYQSAVLAALEEVENGMVAYAEEQVRRQSLAQAVELARSAATLAQEQYRSGLADFQAVLEAQRSLLNAEDQLASSDGAVTAGLVRLYKALGGGWTPEAAAAAPATQHKA
jgi:NodT family efflux transporter outer membrane factor (OMF) lipoprotein